MECLGDLEKFLHDQPVKTPTLIKAALSHVQFETIHPFLDGNGRVGRLLITLLLCGENAISEPTLYLSLYFKRHREIYYELLQKVREKLHDRFGIDHLTIQLETLESEQIDAHPCFSGANCFDSSQK